MVGRAHPRLTSSVVVTFVQVIHKDTSWPASRLRMNLLVQMLTNRAQRVLKNTEGESNRTFGLEISSVFKDRAAAGSPSSSNLDGTGEVDCRLIVAGAALTLESMGALGESSGGRDSSPNGEN